MSNPVPPPGGYQPSAHEGYGGPAQPSPGQGQPGYPAAQGQPGYPAGQGQPGYPAGQGQPGYPAGQGQPGYPAGQGQPSYPSNQGQHGYPPPGAQQGFGDAPPPGAQQGFGEAPPPPAEKKKPGIGKRIGGIALALLVGLGIFGVRSFFSGDDAREAKVGDCIATPKNVSSTEETQTTADVVECGAADADFTVVGRVEGEQDTNSKSCDQFFKEGDNFVVMADRTGKGHLLCLQPKK